MSRTSQMRMLTLVIAVMLLAGCERGAPNDAQVDEPAAETLATTTPTPTTAMAAARTAGCEPDPGEGDRPVAEITAVEYAFQGVPETVPVGAALCLFNAGEEVHDLNVFFVADETAPVEELVPPEGAHVGHVTALPGEYGLSMVVPGEAGPLEVAPLILETPGRYMLYGTMSEGTDAERVREFLAATEEAGRDLGTPPPFGSGEPDFMKGMVADLTVIGEAGSETVLDVLGSDGRFNTLHDLLVNAAPPHFQGFMSQPTWNLTLFAPTDDAFAALPDGVLDGLRADPNTLARVLDHHIVIPYLESEDIATGQLESIFGALEATVEGEVIRVGEATVIEPDIEAPNGIIHAIDTMLVPEAIELENVTG